MEYHRYQADFRQNLRLAGPIMLGQIGQLTVNFADNVMVGRLGAVPLAAVSLSIAVYISFFIAGMGLSFALPPLISEANAAGRERRISQYFKHSLVVNVIYAFICVLIIEGLIPVLELMGQDPDVVLLARAYLRISAWTMIPLMIFQTIRNYSDGLSQTLPAMIAILIGNVINVSLNYILIYGKFGAPSMGVSGAALGTLISRVAMIGILLIILWRWDGLWHYLKNANFRTYKRSFFSKVISLGVPTGLQLFFEVSAFGGASIIMGTLGAKPQAAHQIAINLASITFLICTGLAMAGTIRVGNQFGKRSINGMRRVGSSILLQILFFMIICAVIFAVFRWQLPLIYIDDPDVIRIAAGLLLVAALFQISDGIQAGSLGLLRGIQDVNMPTLITFIAYWIFGLPISYVTARYTSLGPIGVWIGLLVGLSLSASLLSRRFFVRIGQIEI
ncbi:MAG: MATE family efflux transporter [Bacteroidota bacterium]